MRFLIALALLTSTAFAKPCAPENVVTTAATLGATIGSRPIVQVYGSGGVTITNTHRNGSFTVVRECDPAAAKLLREESQALLDGAEGGTPINVLPGQEHEPTFAIPQWLLDR